MLIEFEPIDVAEILGAPSRSIAGQRDRDRLVAGQVEPRRAVAVLLSRPRLRVLRVLFSRDCIESECDSVGAG